MNTLSIKKLFSLSLLTLTFLGIANEVQASDVLLSESAIRARLPGRRSNFERIEAIVESENTINTFVLLFSAAVRAPLNSPEQIALVKQLQQTLTKKFSISLVFGSIIIGPATDFDSLLALIQSQSAISTYDASLNGNLSVQSITRNCHGRRVLEIQGLEYVTQTQSGVSVLIPALDQWNVVETKPGIFKIKSLVATVLTTIQLSP